MTFKQGWEKTELNQSVAEETIDAMLDLAFPGKKIDSTDLLSGGCANLNYLIRLSAYEKAKILRIYLRDKEAVYREEKLAKLLKGRVPIPEAYFVGNHQSYCFAITEFLPGLPLRELLLTHPTQEFKPLMTKVGMLLTKIREIQFTEAGFFDRNLKIREPISQHGYFEYAQETLRQESVAQHLGRNVVIKLNQCFERLHSLFPNETEKNLVHADFDPANILLIQENGEWNISAILDWEFAFAGSSLCDVANMMRYAHQMPTWFRAGFLDGLEMGGYRLTKDWQTSVHLLNLLSLLDCLVRSSEKHPNQRKDIGELIGYILTDI